MLLFKIITIAVNIFACSWALHEGALPIAISGPTGTTVGEGHVDINELVVSLCRVPSVHAEVESQMLNVAELVREHCFESGSVSHATVLELSL
jgi:ABC-type enterobactin transport system permease subunit